MATDVNSDTATEAREDGRIPSEYSRTHYLRFGQAQPILYEQLLDVTATVDYLQEYGLMDNELTRARLDLGKAAQYGDLTKTAERYCDFCGKALTGVEYEQLHDGRDRCVECSRTVVRGRAGLERLFMSVKADMQDKFSIMFDREITVKVVSQDKIARASGRQWKPTTGYDVRAVGLARKGRLGRRLWLENGAPRLPLMSTIAHELTHLWQFDNWDTEKLRQLYGDSYVTVSEGMAEWTEVQYLYLISETHQARRTLEHESSRDDDYGRGLRLFLAQYPISPSIVLEGDTPFRNPEQPIDPALL